MNFNDNIEKIEVAIGYTFRDKSLLRQAFTRTSFCNEQGRGKNKYISNEVLEFFGDSVLSTSIVTLLLKGRTERYEFGLKTELDEGDFSAIRSNLSDKKNLSETTKALGLQKYLLLSHGDEKLGIENEPSVMEDLYESIIGAIYIDCGMELSVVIGVVERTLDVSAYAIGNEAPKKNAKNLLQEWCDDKKHRLPHPEYKVLGESGPDNKKVYECGAYIGDRLYGKGTGKNQKLAETAAAAVALEVLMAENRSPKADVSEVATKMRELASKNKVPSAEYRDLGETENSSINVKEYAIECRFMGRVAVGTGLSKPDARAAAALSIINELEKSDKTKKVQKTNNKSEKQTKKSSKANMSDSSANKAGKSQNEKQSAKSTVKKTSAVEKKSAKPATSLKSNDKKTEKSTVSSKGNKKKSSKPAADSKSAQKSSRSSKGIRPKRNANQASKKQGAKAKKT